MSGHSHAKTIAHAKGIADAKRGAIFSKFGRLIAIAAKDGGDPTINSKLRVVLEQAKSFNMPKENIERAVKKGTGELAGEKLEEVSYEAFGPGGIALIINGITDNTNRALGEVKAVLNQSGGKMAGEGAVRWMFEKRGAITINSKLQITNYKNDELEMAAIEAGADDVKWYGEQLEVYTKPEDLEMVKKTLEEKFRLMNRESSTESGQIKIESASIDLIAKEEVELSEKDKAATEKLFEALDELDTVNDIYSNMKS